MGSSTMIDIVGSMLIGGLLLLTAVRMDEKATSNTFQSQATLTVQQNLTSLVEEIEYYFSKIGYLNNLDSAANRQYYILAGTPDSVAFEADLNRSGAFDTVSYYLGSHVAGCPNPDVRYLFRKIDDQPPVEANLGIAVFHLSYYDQFMNLLDSIFTAPDNVRVITLTVKIEPTVMYDAAFDTVWSVWKETRLISRNLRAR
ncbi:MAG: hypothetical protein M1339_04280 [Bacteroidetes bacterium]|nr:hypothetical protein [Bacteroidota bacterium]